MSFWRNKRQRVLAGICLVWTLLVLWFFLTVPSYQRLESSAGDWLMTNEDFARRSPPNPQLVFLSIGEQSQNLSTLFASEIEKSPALTIMTKEFPWNRAIYAHVMDRLFAAGARAVVLDLVFPNEREGDPEFRAALDKYRDRVVIGSNLLSIRDDANPGQTTINDKPTLIVPAASLMDPGPPRDNRIGFVNVIPDTDQKVRRTHYRTTLLEFFGTPPTKGAEELPSMGARALEKSGHADRIPAGHKPVMIRFSEEILPRSLHEIFVEDQWSKSPYNNGELFRDKIVLIGAGGNTATDRLQTPFGTVLGPTIHLSAINAALNNDFLRPTSLAEDIALIFTSGGLSWLLGMLVRTPWRRALFLIGMLLGSYVILQTLYNVTGLFPIVLSPLVALAGSGFTWSAWEQLNNLREKQKLRKTFERYVSKDVVKELVDNPQSFLNSLSGERRPITVLFSDVRGFTTMTESADPHALVAQLNEYFDGMVSIVFTNHGTLDKFIGDAVMAHWGSIVSEGTQTDAHRAVMTALQMRQGLAALNADWKARGIQELSFGIGVNHGEAIVGNLGCEAKMEVSVIGDAVNLASRLEGVTKTYHIDLCIGEMVEPLVRDAFILRSLDLILVKGKTKPVEIFGVLDQRGPGVSEPAWLARHEEAMVQYRKGNFSAAAQAWQEVLARCPNDSVAEVFLERCAELEKLPTASGWMGVFEMKGK